MSKVYEYHMEMEQLDNDVEYQEYLVSIAMDEEDLNNMADEINGKVA